MTIRHFPETTLINARERTLRSRALVRDGIDPISEERRKQRERMREEGNTVEMVAGLWFDVKKSTGIAESLWIHNNFEVGGFFLIDSFKLFV